MIKLICLSVLILSITSCSTTQEKYDKRIKEGKCDEAAELFSQSGKETSLFEKSKKAVGSFFSYGATGVGYTTDVAVWFSKEVGLRVAICTPIAAAEAAAGGSGTAFSSCFSGIQTSFEKKPTELGKKIYTGTKGWRCADLTPISKRLRALAECYANRNTKEDLKKAKIQIESIRLSPDFYQCISKDEQAAVDKDYSNFNKQLKE